MNRIWKYNLQPSKRHVLYMPRGAQILGVQLQNGEPVIWALVDPDQDLEERALYLAWTGEALPQDKLSYIGTFQADTTVWHLFERTQENQL